MSSRHITGAEYYEDDEHDEERIFRFDPHAPCKRVCLHTGDDEDGDNDTPPPSTLLNFSMDAFRYITEYLTSREFQRLVHVGNKLLLRRMAHSWRHLKMDLVVDSKSLPSRQKSLLSLSNLVSVTDAAALRHLDVGVFLSTSVDIAMLNAILNKLPNLQSLRIFSCSDTEGTLVLPNSLQSLSGVYLRKRSQFFVKCGPSIRHLSVVYDDLMNYDDDDDIHLSPPSSIFPQCNLIDMPFDKLETLEIHDTGIVYLIQTMSLPSLLSLKCMPSLTTLTFAGYNFTPIDLPPSLQSIRLVKSNNEQYRFITLHSFLLNFVEALERSDPLPLLEFIEAHGADIAANVDDILSLTIQRLGKCAPNLKTLSMPDASPASYHVARKSHQSSFPWQLDVGKFHVIVKEHETNALFESRVRAPSIFFKTPHYQRFVIVPPAHGMFDIINSSTTWLRALHLANKITISSQHPIAEFKSLEMLEKLSFHVHFDFKQHSIEDVAAWYRDTLPSNLRELKLKQTSNVGGDDKVASPLCGIWLPRWLNRLSIKGVFPNASLARACGDHLTMISFKASVDACHLDHIATFDALLRPLGYSNGEVSVVLNTINHSTVGGTYSRAATISRMRLLYGSLLNAACTASSKIPERATDMCGSAGNSLEFYATNNMNHIARGMVLESALE